MSILINGVTVSPLPSGLFACTRRSTLSGVVRTMELPVTWEQLYAWERGAMVQRAMPHLSDDQREFLLTGMDSSEWDSIMRDPDE